jgi:hypothetical protein
MVSEYSNPIFLVWMFPTLFPYGLGILEKSFWKVKIFIESKVKYLMNLEDEDHGFCIYQFIFSCLTTFNIDKFVYVQSCKLYQDHYL